MKETRVPRKENKLLLFLGLGFSAAAFVMTLVPFIMFLVPDGVSETSSPLVNSGIYINAFAVAMSFVGVVLTAAARPDASRELAGLNLFFGATAFLLSTALFILCLIFGAIIPLGGIG